MEGRLIKEMLLFILKANCWQSALWTLKRIIKWRAKKESAIRKQPIKRYGRGKVVTGGWNKPRGIIDIRKTDLHSVSTLKKINK